MMNTKGQNTIEYVLLVTAVLMVCIFFFNPKTSVVATGLNSTLNGVVNEVNNLNSLITFPSS